MNDTKTLKQKFWRLNFVRICKVMPDYMSHFESGCDAIVSGTYSQIYGGDDVKSYSLYVIEKGRIVDNISWYEESQLTLLNNQDMGKAELMIEQYNLGR